MSISLLSIILLLFLAESSYSWYSNPYIEKANLDFLLIQPNNRALGMGNAFVALADDASATWWNPAGLVKTKSSEVMISHTFEVPPPIVDCFDHSYLFIARTKPLDESTVIALSGVQHLWGHTERRCELNSGQSFNQWDYSVAFSYGVKINKQFATGLSVKYINSQKESGGELAQIKHLALDAGMLYNTDQSSSFKHSFGLVIRNIGPKFRYGDKEEFKSLPTNLNVGYALTAISRVGPTNVLFDINKRLNKLQMDTFFRNFTYHMGIETWLDDVFGIRVGQWFDNIERDSTLSLGASLRIKKLIKTKEVQIDFSRYFPGRKLTGYSSVGKYAFSLGISQSASS